MDSRARRLGQRISQDWSRKGTVYLATPRMNRWREFGGGGDENDQTMTIQMLQRLRLEALMSALTPLVAKLVSLERIKSFFDSFCGDDQHLQAVSNLDVPLGGACESILDKSLDLLAR